MLLLKFYYIKFYYNIIYEKSFLIIITDFKILDILIYFINNIILILIKNILNKKIFILLFITKI